MEIRFRQNPLKLLLGLAVLLHPSAMQSMRHASYSPFLHALLDMIPGTYNVINPSVHCEWIFRRTSLSINALCVCVYIYIRQLSSFRAPMLWFIDLTVATCHIQYTFLSLCQFIPRENGHNTKILEVRHFCMIQKWPPKVTRRAKH